MEMDRRSFLKGAALTSAAAAAGTLGLTGCSPQTSSASSDSGSTVVAIDSPDGYICSEDWLGSAPTVPSADDTQDFDVVVVGGGHSGTQAALAAAQLGAKVAVVEKHNDGEIVYRGDDICSYNSQLLASWGFGPYDLNEITNEYVRRSNGRCNQEVVRAFVNNSGEMMDNMVSLIPASSNLLDRDGGECIVQIAYDKPDGSDYPVEIAGYKMWASTLQTIGTTNPNPVGKAEQTGISRLAEWSTYAREAAEDLGATWFCGFTAQVCATDASGAVTGIYAEDADGKITLFNASKGVILSTGDFGANYEMVYQLCSECGEYADRYGIAKETLLGMTDCDGSGHKIGCWVGGAIEDHPRPVAGDAPSISFGPLGSTPALFLNSHGERFMNESFAGLILAQSIRQPLPDPLPEIGIAGNFAVLDKKYMQYVQRAGLDHGAPNWGFPEGVEKFDADMQTADPTTATEIAVHGLEIANKSEMAEMFVSTVYIGATPEEAMQNAGLSGDELTTAVAAVKRYNEVCAAGVDDDFGKPADVLIPLDEAPFYVFPQGTSRLFGPGLNTLAGLVTDGNFQVLAADRRSVIKGLYATGNTAGQRYGNSYTGPSAGNNMGHAMTSGRVAGKHAASL
ncbi:MAG: FAD-binding protein [Coriobacteriales bacterium]|nr:FAD-binding protein [Coriobacteriales bacterium]